MRYQERTESQESNVKLEELKSEIRKGVQGIINVVGTRRRRVRPHLAVSYKLSAERKFVPSLAATT